jgi:hypothetical protein
MFADFICGVRVTLAHARNRGHDLTGRAVTALEGVVLDEGLLHRMQRPVRA